MASDMEARSERDVVELIVPIQMRGTRVVKRLTALETVFLVRELAGAAWRAAEAGDPAQRDEYLAAMAGSERLWAEGHGMGCKRARESGVPESSHIWTEHGWPCCYRAAMRFMPESTAKCGGPALCSACRDEVSAAHAGTHEQGGHGRPDQGA